MTPGQVVGCLWFMLTGLVIFETIVTTILVKLYISIGFDDCMLDVIKQRNFINKKDEVKEIDIPPTSTPEATKCNPRGFKNDGPIQFPRCPENEIYRHYRRNIVITRFENED